ncbi:MAG: CocE/NonD family hydrolase [Lachnospiraceae bacterium]|nr:CocE/NonD family hydrolase [Lachnospiraceae bacterium]
MDTFYIDDLKLKYDYKKIIAEQDIEPLYSGYTLEETSFETSDGKKLITYIARPIGCTEPLPVILRRTPYGIKSLRFFFEMSLYGYICISQNCRGSFGSEGEFIPGINEKQDTLETIKWIKTLNGFNGKMAMCGASYLSMEQWQIGDCAPPELKTLYLEFYNPYRYIQLYTKGMFRLEAYAGWTSYNAGVKGSKDLYDRAVKHIPQYTMDEDVLGTHLDWYRDWVSHPYPDAPIWHDMPWSHLETMPQKLDLPVFMHCGWYDPHLEGMLKAYKNIRPEIREKSVLFITPCNHKGTLSSDVDLKNAFDLTGKRFVKSKLAWFGYMLKDEPLADHFLPGKATVYVIGDEKYINTDWAHIKTGERSFFLNTDDLSLDTAENKASCSLSFTYDPKHPVPTHGSEVIMTDYMYNGNDRYHGIRLQEKNTREDVLSFTSLPLEEDITITGSSLKLKVSTTAEDTSFTAKLCIVKANKTYHLRESITALSFEHKNYKAGDIVEINIDFYPIAVNLGAGDSIRIDISSSSFPAYPAHPNTKGLWSKETEPVCAKQTIYGGKLTFKTL